MTITKQVAVEDNSYAHIDQSEDWQRDESSERDHRIMNTDMDEVHGADLRERIVRGDED